MKIGIKDHVEGRFMKKLLLICILIAGIVFITGCIGEEKTDTETPASHQITQESDTQTTDSILKQGDVPGFTLSSCILFAVPKNAVDFDDQIKYADTLPIGYKNVGEESSWIDQSGREIRVELYKYDVYQSTFDANQSTYEEFKDRILGLRKEVYKSSFDYEEGDLHIGDYSFYYAYTDKNTEIQTTVIYSFSNYNYIRNYITVYAVDDKDESKKEAIRIAKIIESRLD